MRPQAHGQNMPRSSAQAPVTHQNGEAALKQRQAQLIAQANKANTPANYQGLTAAQAQQSLYGSLNDDVKVPASNRAAPTDPNAPIATAASRPSTPVKTEPLEGLAGAPR